MRRVLQFIFFLLLLIACALGGWFYWRSTEADRVIAEQKRVISALEDNLDAAWSTELVADLRVDAVRDDPTSQEQIVEMTFVQYKPGTEDEAFRRKFSIVGEEVYVDGLVVQFDRAFVEAGDGLRGKSLILFRRAFGDRQRPVDGALLYGADTDPEIPHAARVDPEPSPFERELWKRFWELANDPAAAREQGIRVAQGEAPHVRVVQGQVYKLTLRRTGGLEIQPRVPAAVLEEPIDIDSK